MVVEAHDGRKRACRRVRWVREGACSTPTELGLHGGEEGEASGRGCHGREGRSER